MLTRQTLTRQAFDALVEKIIHDDLRPGDSLPSTAELIDEFGISRPVVREALSALQACGFVELRNGRAPVVAELDGQLIRLFVSRASRLSRDPMSKLMEVRRPLEIEAASLAASRADDADLARLTDANDTMRAALHDSAVYPRLDAAFHAEIARATGNDILQWMVRSLRSELMTVMIAVREYRDANGLVGREQEQHDAILAALCARDASAAAAVMAAHLDSSITLVQRVEHAATDAPSYGDGPPAPPARTASPHGHRREEPS